MTETGFGPGEYRYTLAEVPAAPVLEEDTSVTVSVAIGEDSNHDNTEYAIYNETNDEYLDVSGNGTPSPAWQTKDSWAVVTAAGLTPSTTYTFKVKARNQEDAETAFGTPAQCTTHNLSTDVLTTVLQVQKASSTISAPSFMSGLAISILLAGKSLHDFGFHVDRISGLDLPCVVPDEELVPGAHTWRIWDEYFAPKRIVLEGYVHAASPDDLRLRLAYLKSFLKITYIHISISYITKRRSNF